MPYVALEAHQRGRQRLAFKARRSPNEGTVNPLLSTRSGKLISRFHVKPTVKRLTAMFCETLQTLPSAEA